MQLNYFSIILAIIRWVDEMWQNYYLHWLLRNIATVLLQDDTNETKFAWTGIFSIIVC